MPSDAELAAWQKQREELAERVVKAADAKRNAVGLATSMRLRVINASQELERLRATEQTLLKLPRGDDPDDSASWTESEGPGIPLVR